MADASNLARPSLTGRRWYRRSVTTARILLTVAITMLGLITLTFFIGRVLPFDPVVAILGDDSSREAYDRVYRQLGLDRPLYEQFFTYLRDVLSFDFGRSLSSGRPVIDDITRVFPATVELALLSIFFGVAIGVPLGVAAAARQGSWIDQLIRVFALIGFSAPNFWLGLVGLAVFFAGLGWVGGPGRLSTFYQFDIEIRTGLILIDSALMQRWDIFQDAVSRLVLPVGILAYGAMAFIARMTRSFMLEQLSQEYIIAARAKGVSRTAVIWVHAFPNIAVQLVTVIALAFGFLLEGAVLTETVFAWPGLGRYMTTALLRGDMNAVLGCVIVIGLIFITLNLLCDLFYRSFDPRTR